MDLQVQITVPSDLVYGVTAARLDFNASIPQTVDGPAGEDGMPTQVPNPELIATDADYVIKRAAGMIESYARQYAPVAPPPAVPPVVINGVPQTVTRRQARQALRIRGYLAPVDKVQAAINAIPDPLQRGLMQDEWDDSLNFERQRPSLIAMAHAIGLATDAQIDELFVFANSLG